MWICQGILEKDGNLFFNSNGVIKLGFQHNLSVENIEGATYIFSVDYFEEVKAINVY